ncbi:hypothetical protein AAG570_013878 [Ranatra chinensis]|uniref:Gustatory receptor n=1 Tax=Ranatra chinensis TaxID=642074 RepID=A0ABD0YDR0_9HEMI
MDDANWLKNEAASMSVREASRKAFFLSKAFGMYPYGDDLRLNWKLLSYSLCLVLTTVGLAVYNTIQVETGTIDVFIGRVEFISLSASVVVGYVKMLTARSDLRDFFAAYERVHADLVPVGLTTSYANKEIYLSACFSLVSLTMISLVDLGMDSFQDELSAYWLTWTLFSYLGWAMQDSCVRQFTALLHYLKNDFVRLKLFLRETARSPNLNCRDTKIEAAASAHDSLTTVCAKLNSIYSIQLLFIVTNDFVILVISTYYILAIAGTLKKLRLVVLIITEILRAILYIVQMWHICSSCQDTSEQACYVYSSYTLL